MINGERIKMNSVLCKKSYYSKGGGASYIKGEMYETDYYLIFTIIYDNNGKFGYWVLPCDIFYTEEETINFKRSEKLKQILGDD